MSTFVNRLWNDEAGFIVSVELLLIATIAVIGLITGVTSIRNAVVSELADVAGAVQELNQSYTFYGVIGHGAATRGTQFVDSVDFCDDDSDDQLGEIDMCITMNEADLDEDGAPAIPSILPGT